MEKLESKEDQGGLSFDGEPVLGSLTSEERRRIFPHILAKRAREIKEGVERRVLRAIKERNKTAR